jgi:hypothetical protein
MITVIVRLRAATASPSILSPPLRPHERRTSRTPPPPPATIGAGALLWSHRANPQPRGRRRPASPCDGTDQRQRPLQSPAPYAID